MTDKEHSLANKLEAIRAAARKRHEKARRAAKRKGRENFPLFPYECSWAYEQEFYRKELK